MDAHIILLATIGAAVQELAHWYWLREKLAAPRYAKVLRSAPYWIVTALMIAGAGVGTAAWFGSGQPADRTILLMGAAFPLVLKKAVSAFGSTKVTLGESESSLAAYFDIEKRRNA